MHPSRLPPKVVSSSTGPIRNPFVNHSSVTLNRARSSSTEHLLLSPPRVTKKRAERAFPVYSCGTYATTKRHFGVDAHSSRVSNVTVRLSANDSRVAKASAQRKGQPIDTGYHAYTQISLFAKRNIFKSYGFCYTLSSAWILLLTQP